MDNNLITVCKSPKQTNFDLIARFLSSRHFNFQYKRPIFRALGLFITRCSTMSVLWEWSNGFLQEIKKRNNSDFIFRFWSAEHFNFTTLFNVKGGNFKKVRFSTWNFTKRVQILIDFKPVLSAVYVVFPAWTLPSH